MNEVEHRLLMRAAAFGATLEQMALTWWMWRYNDPRPHVRRTLVLKDYE